MTGLLGKTFNRNIPIIKKGTNGREIIDKVCDHIGVEEKDYFGLKFINNKDKQLSWLDNLKTLEKQLGKGPYVLIFGVKFYPPSPSDLQEDITRYHFVLQLRDDLLRGRIMCSVPTHALLASYVVEAEKGDYDPAAHGPDYLDNLKFMPNQPPEFLEKVREFHKKHKGLSPSDAEFQYLENARKLPLYGIELHHAYDGDDSEVVLGISAQGLHVIRHGREINKFLWPSIHKVFFRGRRFYTDVRVVTESECEDLMIGFRCRTSRELKRLYRSAVEHHTFFRQDAQLLVAKKVNFFKLGSRFRYSGRRTFHQTKFQQHSRPPPAFTRVSSERFSIRLRNNRLAALMSADIARNT